MDCPKCNSDGVVFEFCPGPSDNPFGCPSVDGGDCPVCGGEGMILVECPLCGGNDKSDVFDSERCWILDAEKIASELE
jgi:hypothetical protein